MLHTGALPDFPWDSLVPVRERAARHPDGVVDLTIGTPVDPVPEAIRRVLARHANAPGYPPTVGRPELREAIYAWLERRRGLATREGCGILPTLGSKEMVALLPALVGLGEGDAVAFPHVAYPTYDVGARLAGARPVPVDPRRPQDWPDGIGMLWINSPGNPDGHVLDVGELARIVEWARERGAIVASDECYAALTWDVDEAPSLLDERVCGGDYRGLLSLYSLSKQSNLAGYRAAFLAGDAHIVGPITEVRKHAGFLMPGPVQEAMAYALGDDAHVAAQREVYGRRREHLLGALRGAGLVNDPLSHAGLYLWVADARGVAGGWDIVYACSELGIVVTPGDFYGEAGRDRVRMSLTATDDAVAEAVRRLVRLPKVLAARG
ncbi:MAG: succinyldiaminopimelate transaminase [Actinomycetaceae bacterium]|nr:succinyldiaminopimelate transaminase [Actinomycetaceae bacterium]